MDEPSLDFDAWAALAAHMLRLDIEARTAILEELDIGLPAWEEAEAYWARALASDLASASFARAQRYASFCCRELAARKARSNAPEIAADATVDVATPLGDPLPFASGSIEEALVRIAASSRQGPRSERRDDADSTLIPTDPLEAVTLPFVRVAP